MTARANATWSIVAAERSSRSFGHAIVSCVSVPLDDGYGSVEGEGAMVTQANFHPPALTKGLELLTAGKTPAETIAALTDSAFDAEYPTRQHGNGTTARSAFIQIDREGEARGAPVRCRSFWRSVCWSADETCARSS